jgi:Arc/MetJ-type ribon-helix-helix transcriptional regulator
MVKTLELAMSKAAALPEASQEELGREIIRRIAALEALRAEIDIGIRELDSGLGRELDFDEFLRRARAEHAKTK